MTRWLSKAAALQYPMLSAYSASAKRQSRRNGPSQPVCTGSYPSAEVMYISQPGASCQAGVTPGRKEQAAKRSVASFSAAATVAAFGNIAFAFPPDLSSMASVSRTRSAVVRSPYCSGTVSDRSESAVFGVRHPGHGQCVPCPPFTAR
jgi:hypothetical protein